MKGIDISDNQGIIDWKQVKGAGVEFVIMRTTRRSGSADHYLATNIKNCLEFDIPFDFYKYSYAVTTDQAAAEAKNVIDLLKSYGVLPDKNTIIYMDVEDKIQFALSTAELTAIVHAFKDVIVSAGYTFGLYMGKYAYEHNEVDVKQFPDLTWIARYYKGDERMHITDVPDQRYRPIHAAGKLRGWQYTSSGFVDGINGKVDLNEYYGEIEKSSVDIQYYLSPEFTLIDALNKIGVDSSYKNRKKIAERNGIIDYSGTKEQNLDIYQKLISGILKK